MKLLFVHDAEKIKKDNYGNYYTDGSYNSDIWDRYLSLSKQLSVIFRKESKEYDINYAQAKFNIVKKEINLVFVIDRTVSIKSYLSSKNKKINRNIIEKEVYKCDFMIIRLPCEAGLIAIEYAKKYSKPYLIELVACPWDAYWNYSYKGKLLAPFIYRATKKAVENAEYVIYVTNGFLQKRYPTKGKNIGCSDVALPKLDDSILNKRLNKINIMSNSNSIVIGTIAAVDVRYKGQEYVIKAISKLNKEGYEFEYHILGGGDNSYLKSVAKKYNVVDKIKFLGSLPHDKVFEYLDNIDIYIQPSKLEGLPRALIEAMSRGCPCLGSKTGGIPELLNDKFVFHNSSVNEICMLLKQMDSKTMIEEARRNFEKAKEYDRELLDRKRSCFIKKITERLVLVNDKGITYFK